MINSRLRNPRQLFSLMPIIVLALVFCLYAIYVARRAEAREQLQGEISNLIIQYLNGETQTIDLSKISSITWDRLHIFGPYSPLNNIQKILGYSWRPDTFIFPGPERSFVYLIFTRDGKVVQYVEYPMDSEYFSGEGRNIEGYKLDEALFVINEYGYVMWLYE